jgi:flagellar motor protein MotB
MWRAKTVLLVIGVPFVMAAIGCNEAKLKTDIQNLQNDKKVLDQRLKEKMDELAVVKNENAKLTEGLQAKESEVLALKSQPPKVVEKGVEGAGTDEGGETAAGWRRTSVGDMMTISGHLLFGPGSATLTAEGRGKLAKVARDLKTTYAGRIARVYGFTDNDPIVKSKKLWQDNLDLSANRAMAVVRYLWSQGVPKASIETVAMGETHPVASNSSADGKKKNRRVEILVVGAK